MSMTLGGKHQPKHLHVLLFWITKVYKYSKCELVGGFNRQVKQDWFFI